MFNFHTDLRRILKDILPTYYEFQLTKDTEIPCISYQEKNNSNAEVGDTIWYSNFGFYIKIWAYSIEELQQYADEVDNALRPLGFKRTSSQELQNPNSTLMQKIMLYDAKAVEWADEANTNNLEA